MTAAPPTPWDEAIAMIKDLQQQLHAEQEQRGYFEYALRYLMLEDGMEALELPDTLPWYPLKVVREVQPEKSTPEITYFKTTIHLTRP